MVKRINIKHALSLLIYNKNFTELIIYISGVLQMASSSVDSIFWRRYPCYEFLKDKGRNGFKGMLKDFQEKTVSYL